MAMSISPPGQRMTAVSKRSWYVRSTGPPMSRRSPSSPTSSPSTGASISPMPPARAGGILFATLATPPTRLANSSANARTSPSTTTSSSRGNPPSKMSRTAPPTSSTSPSCSTRRGQQLIPARQLTQALQDLRAAQRSRRCSSSPLRLLTAPGRSAGDAAQSMRTGIPAAARCCLACATVCRL